jgi:hypothetical protein
MCMKQTGMIRSENPVTLLICSLQIPYVLVWEALDAMKLNNVTCGTGCSYWDGYEDYSIEGRDGSLYCGHLSSPWNKPADFIFWVLGKQNCATRFETEGYSRISVRFNTTSGLSQPRTKTASGTVESLILKKLISFSQFFITVFHQACKRHDFADLSSTVHYVLETSMLYANAYFREHFSSN